MTGEYGLTPTTFDGTNINDGTNYLAHFQQEDDPFRLLTREPVEVEVPGDYAFPTSPRSQPESKIIPLHVQILAETQAAFNALKTLFDPLKGDVLLKATDGASPAITYRLTVRVVELIGDEDDPTHFIARLYVARPIFETEIETTDSQTANASPKTWATVINTGTVRAYPVFRLKPTVAKAHTVDYLHRWPVSIASRTELEMLSTDGLPYPIDVADNALNTGAEITASRMQIDGDDLRVWVDGEEIRRDLAGMTRTDTKVWASDSWKPKVEFVIAANMTNVSPANGESIDLSQDLPPDVAQAGFFILGTETIHYGARTMRQVQQILRGSRGTTAAAHNAGDIGYFRQHDIYLLSDYTAATDPNGADLDRKPVIDLALSSNLKHVYVGPFTAIGTYRSGQWVRRYTNDSLFSPAISFLDGATPAFRDIAPSAAAPQFNNLELYVPCGVKAAAGAIKHDVAVGNLLTLKFFGADLEGLEALLGTYDTTNDGAALTLTPALPLQRLRYNAGHRVITGPHPGLVGGVSIGGITAECGQVLVLEKSSLIAAIMLRLMKTATADGAIQVRLSTLGASGPDKSIINSAGETIPLADIPLNVYGDVLLVLSPARAVPAGTYILRANRTASAGTIGWGHAYARIYAGGSAWVEVASVWSEIADATRECLFIGDGTAAPQSDAPIGSSDIASLDNPELTFDDATPRTPLIVRGTQETIYFLRGVLKNDDTGAEITIACPLCLNDILEIDPFNRTVKRIPASAADPTEDVPWACTFSDEIEWLNLIAGINNLRYTEAGIGTVVIETIFRGACG